MFCSTDHMMAMANRCKMCLGEKSLNREGWMSEGWLCGDCSDVLRMWGQAQTRPHAMKRHQPTGGWTEGNIKKFQEMYDAKKKWVYENYY